MKSFFARKRLKFIILLGIMKKLQIDGNVISCDRREREKLKKKHGNDKKYLLQLRKKEGKTGFRYEMGKITNFWGFRLSFTQHIFSHVSFFGKVILHMIFCVRKKQQKRGKQKKIHVYTIVRKNVS